MASLDSLPPELPDDYLVDAEEPPMDDDYVEPETLYRCIAEMEDIGGFDALSTEPPESADLWQTRMFDAPESAPAESPF